MADPAKDKEKSNQEKMVPLSQLMALKEKEKKTRAELDEAKTSNTQLASELKIAKTNIDDDEEVKGVRKYLVDEDTRIKEAAEKLDKDTATFNEGKKESQVKALIEKYGVTEEELQGEDDPEKKALQIFAERTTEEKAKGEQPPGSVFERGSGGVVSVEIADMSDEDFGKHWEKEKAKAEANANK